MQRPVTGGWLWHTAACSMKLPMPRSCLCTALSPRFGGHTALILPLFPSQQQPQCRIQYMQPTTASMQYTVYADHNSLNAVYTICSHNSLNAVYSICSHNSLKAAYSICSHNSLNAAYSIRSRQQPTSADNTQQQQSRQQQTAEKLLITISI